MFNIKTQCNENKKANATKDNSKHHKSVKAKQHGHKNNKKEY